MTLDKFRRIDLRLDKAYGYIPDNQFAKQGDYNGVELVVQLADNGVVKDQSGTQLLFKWGHNQRKNSGQKYFEALDLSQGVFKVTYPTQMLFEGTVTATIHIIQDGDIIPTRNFTLRVEKDPTNDNLVVAENDFSVLQEALLQVNEWNGKFEEKYNGLEEEYNEEINSLNRQLAQKANEADLEIERARISNLTANAGDTDGNAELLDIRVGFDGITYPTAGEATRAIGNYMKINGEPWEGEQYVR